MIFLPLLAVWLGSAPSSLAASNPALRRYPYLTDVVGAHQARRAEQTAHGLSLLRACSKRQKPEGRNAPLASMTIF